MEKKNIHVIPTENYSPLVNSTSKHGGLFLSKYYSPMKQMGDSYQHIYITSDEKIKEGDWYLFPLYKIGYSIKCYNSEQHFNQEPCISLANLKAKKIILTTDQDLIKDGVQAIDDTFLEWFVNNPECEEVEITYGLLRPFESENKGYIIHCPSNEVVEEPKSLNMEKKTIEEAARKFESQFVDNGETYHAFKAGAEWYSKNQSEQMYSEEDMIQAFNEGQALNVRGRLIQGSDWFTQYKKNFML
jgi:hypothetical protein